MQPWHPSFSPDGATVYAPNRLSQSVSFIDAASGTVDTTFEGDGTEVVLSEPHGSVVTADGALLFVSNRNLGNNDSPVRPAPYPFTDDEGETIADIEYGFVTVIDTATREVVGVIPMGKWASGMAIYDPR